MTAFIIGGLFEAVGYAARVRNADDPTALNPFIIQTLLILLGPALMAATVYMILGRIINLTSGERYALIRRTWLTKIFVLGDVLSFLVTAGGASMLSNTNGTPKEVADRQKLGSNILLVGLFIQIVFFGLFMIVAVLFQVRGREHFQRLPPQLLWKKHMYTLYAVSLCILVRSLFRVVEYIQGVDGFLFQHEVFPYVFDATLIFIAVAAMNVVHPADIARLLKEKEAFGNMGEMQRLGNV